MEKEAREEGIRKIKVEKKIKEKKKGKGNCIPREKQHGVLLF